MIRRNRILRNSASLRTMVRETFLQPSDFIVPVFITEGQGFKDEISSMPGYFRFSLELAVKELEECYALGIKSALVFVKVPMN
jgi:Delta-aminolevulinic acid dehydratase